MIAKEMNIPKLYPWAKPLQLSKEDWDSAN